MISLISDLTLRIYGYLEPKDLLSVSQTSKQNYQLAHKVLALKASEIKLYLKDKDICEISTKLPSHLQKLLWKSALFPALSKSDELWNKMFFLQVHQSCLSQRHILIVNAQRKLFEINGTEGQSNSKGSLQQAKLKLDQDQNRFAEFMEEYVDTIQNSLQQACNLSAQESNYIMTTLPSTDELKNDISALMCMQEERTDSEGNLSLEDYLYTMVLFLGKYSPESISQGLLNIYNIYFEQKISLESSLENVHNLEQELDTNSMRLESARGDLMQIVNSIIQKFKADFIELQKELNSYNDSILCLHSFNELLALLTKENQQHKKIVHHFKMLPIKIQEEFWEILSEKLHVENKQDDWWKNNFTNYLTDHLEEHLKEKIEDEKHYNNVQKKEILEILNTLLQNVQRQQMKN